MFVFHVFSFSISSIPCFFVLCCVLFLVLCSPCHIFVQVYRSLLPGENSIAVNKCHVLTDSDTTQVQLRMEVGRYFTDIGA